MPGSDLSAFFSAFRSGDGRDDLVPFQRALSYDTAELKERKGNVPAAPHARARGRLLRPAMTATFRRRYARMVLIMESRMVGPVRLGHPYLYKVLHSKRWKPDKTSVVGAWPHVTQFGRQ